MTKHRMVWECRIEGTYAWTRLKGEPLNAPREEYRQIQDDYPVYVASRASIPERPAMWRHLRDVEKWNITSTWIDEDREGQTKNYKEFWHRIHMEIAAAQALILYAEQDDFPLKGAYIEAGIAIGLGRPIFVVLPNVILEENVRPIGSWLYHPSVVYSKNLGEVYDYLQTQPWKGES